MKEQNYISVEVPVISEFRFTRTVWAAVFVPILLSNMTTFGVLSTGSIVRAFFQNWNICEHRILEHVIRKRLYFNFTDFAKQTKHSPLS